jgi:RHS repeat-associated protein
MMDGSENIVARYLYGPYGKLVGQWGPMASKNTMQFSSMPRHNLSGLSLYPFRAYEPNLQRWLNQDPIQERGGLNLYGFVGNSPVNVVDPLGLAPGYGNPISGPNGPVGPSPFGGAGYGIGFNGPDPQGPVEALYGAYNSALDQITPPINPNTDPYSYAASQTARQMAFAAAMAAATDRLVPPAVKCPARGGLTGPEAARAALGKGPLANPGAPLTDAMKAALQDNLAAAQNNLSLAQQGLNRAGNPFMTPQAQQIAISTAQARIDEITSVLQSGVQAAKN